MTDSASKHVSVLLQPVMDGLDIRSDGTYVDLTLGGAGHLLEILQRLGSAGRVVGVDCDEVALARAHQRIGADEKRVTLVHGNFSDALDLLKWEGITEVDGVVMDLGISSDQLDDPRRGFTFQEDGPLDMRLDRTRGLPASDFINQAHPSELIKILRDFADERDAPRIVRRIVEWREQKPFETTGALADVVEAAKGGRKGRLHPATKTFQALRMVVNQELESLERGLHGALALLKVGGRLAVISFHSGEDRIVKKFFRGHAGRMESLVEGGERWVGECPKVRELNRKPIMADEAEQQANPRARSAKLRVAERIED